MALLESRFESQILDLSIGVNVILPEHPQAWDTPPAVLYLLHGLSDDHTIWNRRTSIERYAADYNLAVVMPDAYKSFYCNMEHGSDYWTFLSDELPMLISRWFNVSADPQASFVNARYLEARRREGSGREERPRTGKVPGLGEEPRAGKVPGRPLDPSG